MKLTNLTFLFNPNCNFLEILLGISVFFNIRFTELIKERFNVDSIRVKKLLNKTENDEIIIKSLLILSFCISNQGYQKLKNFLYDF